MFGSMHVTVNYLNNEKEFVVTSESDDTSSPGDAVNKIIHREKNATSFIFVLVRMNTIGNVP